MLRTSILSVVFLSIGSFTQAQTPLEALHAASSDGPLYSFDMTIKTSEMTARGHIDPSQPEGQRLTIYAPDEKDWDDDFRKAAKHMDEEATGDIWCSEFAKTIPADAELVSETEHDATYKFNPLTPEDETDMGKIFRHLTGIVTIAKANPDILSLSLTAPKPFKPLPVAKLNTFKLALSCERGPDGRTYISTFDMRVTGSAMFQSFEERDYRTITNLTPVTVEDEID